MALDLTAPGGGATAADIASELRGEGKRVYVRRSSGTQSLTLGSSNNIIYPTVDNDADSVYDNTTGIITIPAAWDGKWCTASAGYVIDGFNTCDYAAFQINNIGIAVLGRAVTQVTNGAAITTEPFQVATGETYVARIFPTNSSGARSIGFSENATFFSFGWI